MDIRFILASIGVFLVTILVLVVILLIAKRFLVTSGKVKLTINGDNQLDVESGSTLLNTLAVNNIFLSSAYVLVPKSSLAKRGSVVEKTEVLDSIGSAPDVSSGLPVIISEDEVSFPVMMSEVLSSREELDVPGLSDAVSVLLVCAVEVVSVVSFKLPEQPVNERHNISRLRVTIRNFFIILVPFRRHIKRTTLLK